MKLIATLLGAAAAKEALLNSMSGVSDECEGCENAPESPYSCINPPCNDKVCGQMKVDVESCTEDTCSVECGLEEGYYGDMGNCQAYCFCSGATDDSTGNAVPSRWSLCPAGTYWDPDCKGYHKILKSDGYEGGCCNHPSLILNFHTSCVGGCERLSKYHCGKSSTCDWNPECNCCQSGQPVDPPPAEEELPPAKLVCQGKDLDVSFIVDGSGSIGPVNFDATRKFLKSIISNFDLGPTQVSLVQYSYDAEVEFQNLADFATIEDTINSMPYQAGSTRTGAALNFWQGKKQPRSGTLQVSMVFTDGVSYDEAANLISIRGPEYDSAHDRVIAVGVGSADEEQLKLIATDPDSANVLLKTWEDLKDMAAEIAEKMCTE